MKAKWEIISFVAPTACAGGEVKIKFSCCVKDAKGSKENVSGKIPEKDERE